MDGMLSQDEINALLSGLDMGNDEPAAAASDASSEEELLSDIEKDAIGEIANISMGTSATTLYSLVNRKVNITTPMVSLATWNSIVEEYPTPCVFIQIKYTVGLNGSNILVLKENDVKIITDLMMGGDGTNTEGELGELHLSAISEAMNQMMGSSATSLSSMIGRKIDISPPQASLVDVNELKDAGMVQEFINGTFVKISFRMQIGDLVDSIIMQLYPLDFAHSLYDIFMGQKNEPEAEPAQEATPEPQPFTPPPVEAPQPAAPQMAMPQQTMDMPQMGMTQMGMQPMGMPQMGMPQMMPQQAMGMQPMGMPQMVAPTNVQPAQFQAFAPNMASVIGQENINLIMDVPLEVTVELGRTVKTIHEILDFAPGTIIELEKLAGEPIDVLVNGKYVAKGEVVVIEENFGIRVTEIIKD
ncbi:MAG: flagellar motor switch phosphatase FliY [Lachnospiraceae bacterium]|nr:flagellar motor switch phosphatase FliY [Lachnospiraceae bacterium]